MREVRYQTPHGINVSRIASKLPLSERVWPVSARTGRISRHLPVFGLRISGAVFALGHRFGAAAARTGRLPARGHVSSVERARRGDQPNAGHGSARSSALGRFSRGKRHASRHARSRCRSCFPKRSAASSPRSFPFCARSRGNSATRTTTSSRSPARSDTICCFSSSRFRCVCRASSRKDLQLFLCDDIIYMDRKREQIERFTYEFEQNGSLDARPRAHRRTNRACARARARPDHLRSHAGRIHGERGDGPRRHAARRLLRSGSRADVPHSLLGQSVRIVLSGCSAPIRVLMNF